MKIKLILLMYDVLIGGAVVSRKEFCGEHKISERTFYRYMNELSLFLREWKQEYFVDEKEPDGAYFIKNHKRQRTDRACQPLPCFAYDKMI